jgi:hypothetical protein
VTPQRRWQLIAALAAEHGAVCYWCRLPVGHHAIDPNHRGAYMMATLDHVKPQCRGGRSDLTNLRLSCYPCNHAKSDRQVWIDWIPVRGERGGQVVA